MVARNRRHAERWCAVNFLRYVGENTYFMDWPADTEIPKSLVKTAKGKQL